MPAYNPSILISDCYGSAGSITFYHRDGKCRWRSKSTLSFAATPRQSATLDVHRRALAAWRTIPDTEKERWHDIAKNVPPHRPPFGSGGHISGHNLFVSAYHGFVTLGDEQILAWNSLALSQAGRSVLGSSSKITGSNLYMRLNYWIVYCGGDALTAPPMLRGVEAPSGAAISLTADAFTFTLDSEPTENMADLKLVIMASAPQSNGVTRAYSKAVGIGTPKDPVSDEYDLKAEYDARHGAPSDAAPKVFMKWFFVDTTGEVSGEQMALAQLTAATEPDAGV